MRDRRTNLKIVQLEQWYFPNTSVLFFWTDLCNILCTLKRQRWSPLSNTKAMSYSAIFSPLDHCNHSYRSGFLLMKCLMHVHIHLNQVTVVIIHAHGKDGITNQSDLNEVKDNMHMYNRLMCPLNDERATLYLSFFPPCLWRNPFHKVHSPRSQEKALKLYFIVPKCCVEIG